MFAGWPDAIMCHSTLETSTNTALTRPHYLMVANESNNHQFWYRRMGWEMYDQTSNYVFYPNGSYWAHLGDDSVSNCDGKSIQELSANGMAFDLFTK